MRRFFIRLRNLAGSSAEIEMNREMASHLALLEEDFELRGLPPGADLSRLQTTPGVCRMESHDNVTRVFVSNATAVLAPLQQALSRYPEHVMVQITPLTLADLFLQLTGKELRD